MTNHKNYFFTRRRFLQGTAAAGLLTALDSLVPAYARQADWGHTATNFQYPDLIDLHIRNTALKVEGKDTSAITINETVPGPLIRLREGQIATMRVTNHLKKDTSIHWHGLILPQDMDGVPGVSFAGIRPGETFTYRFPIQQNGTYWYHSHSGLQEQLGHFGPMIIDPAEPEPFKYDRDYVVMLSDWTFEDPYVILKKLKKLSSYYNFQRRTMQDFFRDIKEKGWDATMSDRLAWGSMRMDPTDIADITGSTYTYMMNGLGPETNWTGLFRPGERLRLRFINAATMSYFDLRIPGLKMTVVQVDGQNIQPVTVDELRIAVAETYDVIVEPDNTAYTIFAESMDRSGYARGTLATQQGMSAAIPARRPRPVRTMADMGMADMDMGGADKSAMDNKNSMSAMKMPAKSPAVKHGPDRHGPGAAAVAEFSSSRLHEPGLGLKNNGRRVLVYGDLRSLDVAHDKRKAAREIELHLTGNMERYMWSFDGKKFSEVDGPIQFYNGERVRLTFVNDTMMDHPLHLHGMWMELDTGAGEYKPRKHTISVQPGERLSADITVDAPLGEWAFHCHLLYHLDMGMLRVVSVSDRTEETGS